MQRPWGGREVAQGVLGHMRLQREVEAMSQRPSRSFKKICLYPGSYRKPMKGFMEEGNVVSF